MMKTKTGQLFEEALKNAEIDLKPGTEIKIRVQGKGKRLHLVANTTHLTEFESQILERSKKISDKLKPYHPKLSTGEKIRTLRKTVGWTLEELALKAEMSKGSLGSIEKGERPAGLVILRKIAKALGCPLSVLVD